MIDAVEARIIGGAAGQLALRIQKHGVQLASKPQRDVSPVGLMLLARAQSLLAEAAGELNSLADLIGKAPHL